MNRDLSLDFVRGFFVLVFCLVHPIYHWSYDTQSYFFEWTDYYLGAVGSVAFILLAGYSSARYLFEKSTSYTTKRALFFISLSTLLSLLTWSPVGLWINNSLFCIGLGILLTPLIKKTLPGVLLMLLLGLTFYFSQNASTLESFRKNYPVPTLPLSKILSGDFSLFGAFFDQILFHGDFAIIPWLLFFILGALLSRVPTNWKKLLTGANVFLCVALYLSVENYSYYPPAPLNLLLLLSLSVVYWTLLNYLGKKIPLYAFRFMSQAGSKSLDIYFFHHFLVFSPIWICGYLFFDNSSHYWQNISSSGVSAIFGLLVFVLLSALFNRGKESRSPLKRLESFLLKIR